MKASRLIALACASLAASVRQTWEIYLDFDDGCVTVDNHAFTDALTAREYIATIPKVAGKCENVMVVLRYTQDKVLRCGSPDGGVVEEIEIEDSLLKEFRKFNHSGDVYLNNVSFHYDGEVSGDCHAATITGTADATKECFTPKRRPYAMKSGYGETNVFFSPSNPGRAVTFDDLAVQANFRKECVVPSKAKSVVVHLGMPLELESTIGVKDVSIVFPERPDCAIRGCDSIIGTNGVEVCLDNARVTASGRRAVYTRTYLNLGSGQCDPAVPGKLHLNMDTILADDQALAFKDKRTVVTSVKFGQEAKDGRCTNTILSLIKRCSDAPSVRSTLREDPGRRFTFIGEEAITDDSVATNYTVTTTCDAIVSPYRDEVTVRTEFTIPYNFATFERSERSGSFARIQLAVLLTAAASTLAINFL